MLQLQTGADFYVRVNDPNGVRAASEAKIPGAAILLAVRSSNGTLIPIPMTASDSTGSDHHLPVPVGANLVFAAFSNYYSMTNSTGAPLAATGGASSYTWSVTGVSWLSFSGSTLSGTATATGTFPITVTVVDTTGLPNASRQFTLTVGNGLGISPESLPGVVVGNHYSAVLTGIGGVPPYSWVLDGQLPLGLSFSPTHNDCNDFRHTNDTASNVGIGTTLPQYRLSVNAVIQVREVLVNTGWSDYVFAPDYHLAPLREIASYIRENHHLPGISTEAEVQGNGVRIGEVQSKLLAKIEELTLHMIEIEERNDRLERQNIELGDKVARPEAH